MSAEPKNAPRRVLQCKDIPDRPILEMLAQNQAQRHNWCWDEWNLAKAMPAGIPSKLVLAKIKMMIRRGVVDGCPCGCRGDFVITPKGLAEISRYQNQSTSKNACVTDYNERRRIEERKAELIQDAKVKEALQLFGLKTQLAYQQANVQAGELNESRTVQAL